MRFKIFWSLACLFILSPFYAHGFTLIGSGIESSVWPGDTLGFSVDASCDSYNSTLNTALQEAADLWNSVPTSGLELGIVGSGGGSIVSCADLAEGVLGVGTFRGNLQIDSVFLQTGSAVAIAATVAHEIGHVLGLGHSSSEDALMYYAESGVRESLVLSQDDMHGISYLYPRDELGSDSVFGCGTVAPISSGSSGGGFGTFISLTGILFLWFMLRKSRLGVAQLARFSEAL